jgi:hypothetical protein
MTQRRVSISLVFAILLQVWIVAPASAASADEVEACFVNAINADRAGQGANPVELDSQLVAYARDHSAAMLAAGGLFHSTPAQLSPVLPEGWTSWAENVGYAPDCSQLHQAFMGSPGHRANILNPGSTRVAVGVVLSSGYVWATEVFYSHPDSLAGLPPFWDDDGSVHEENIIILYDRGVSGGCADGQFCPEDPLTRGQMAAFLARALDLPAATVDFFSDDDASFFEADIDSIAAASITSGCASGEYCPNDPLTRGQMAAFLVRALDLPATTTDYFSDDDGNRFENEINALAAAGITTGYSDGQYLPNGLVTRAQMASFLVRGLGW